MGLRTKMYDPHVHEPESGILMCMWSLGALQNDSRLSVESKVPGVGPNLWALTLVFLGLWV